MNTAEQEAIWVLRAQADDREAMESLLRSLQPALRRYLTGLVGASTADDPLQETLITICGRIVDLRDPALLRAWAYRIASRNAFRHIRKARLWSGREDAAGELDELPAAQPVPSPELLDRLLTHEAVSPMSRAVLALHFRDELTLSEIAAVLEIPLGTVKSRLGYGLKTLREQLQKTIPNTRSSI